MFVVRRLTVLLLVIVVLASLSACQDGSSASEGGSRSLAKNFQWQPLYGDGTRDGSGIIARVGEVEISQRDLDLYFEELPDDQQKDYAGADGKRLLLKHMVDVSLMAQGAVDKKLYNDPNVARTIISARRNTLEAAMINNGLLKDQSPTEDEISEYFMKNRNKYRQQGVANARHIECLTQEDADAAYRRLLEGGPGNDWIYVVQDFSVNEESRAQGGNAGWFNKGGPIPFIAGSMKFTDITFDLDIGLHPPFKILDRWHVVEVLSKKHERPSTFAEAKGRVEVDIMPAWQDAIIKDYLRAARKERVVEIMGDFAPGKGLSVDELIAQAVAVPDVKRKFELLNLVLTDYPEDDRADDALFMAANVAVDSGMDLRVAERYLRRLLEDYPDSELVEDARFLEDNLYNPAIRNPQSMEELRKATKQGG